jgi:hypothetical protein
MQRSPLIPALSLTAEEKRLASEFFEDPVKQAVKFNDVIEKLELDLKMAQETKARADETASQFNFFKKV